jgi:hypothetical protein
LRIFDVYPRSLHTRTVADATANAKGTIKHFHVLDATINNKDNFESVEEAKPQMAILVQRIETNDVELSHDKTHV